MSSIKVGQFKSRKLHLREIILNSRYKYFKYIAKCIVKLAFILVQQCSIDGLVKWNYAVVIYLGAVMYYRSIHKTGIIS